MIGNACFVVIFHSTRRNSSTQISNGVVTTAIHIQMTNYALAAGTRTTRGSFSMLQDNDNTSTEIITLQSSKSGAFNSVIHMPPTYL